MIANIRNIIMSYSINLSYACEEYKKFFIREKLINNNNTISWYIRDVRYPYGMIYFYRTLLDMDDRNIYNNKAKYSGMLPPRY